MDRLHEAVSRRVEEATQRGEDAAVTFEAIRALAYGAAGREAPAIARVPEREFVPHLTEPWFCCAEPSRGQMDQVCCDDSAGCCG
jgi:hypothetical protein